MIIGQIQDNEHNKQIINLDFPNMFLFLNFWFNIGREISCIYIVQNKVRICWGWNFLTLLKIILRTISSKCTPNTTTILHDVNRIFKLKLWLLLKLLSVVYCLYGGFPYWWRPPGLPSINLYLLLCSLKYWKMCLNSILTSPSPSPTRHPGPDLTKSNCKFGTRNLDLVVTVPII